MESQRARVLLVEDTPSLSRVYQAYLRGEAVDVHAVATGAEALAVLDREMPDVVLLDLHLPDMNGMDILKRVHDDQLPCAVVVITAHGSVNIAVEAMRLGAHDFLIKPFNADRLVITLRNVLEHRRLSRIVATWREDFDRHSFCGFIGGSLAMQGVYRIIDSAAASRATVFITGESGTGKELCAEAIHKRSPRRQGPFVALNCGAIPHDLMESEIFGHVKGAFSGAVADREGAAARADGGTLFLDEICEMDPDLQTKLLRFIQTGTIQKVGGGQAQRVDVRFVCATNRDPWAEVQAGRFREDLYYRLHVIPVNLPPLREREDDALVIARHLLQAYAAEENRHFRAFDPDVEQAILAFPWPGNVRQLQNVIRNIVVLHDAELVTQDMLPPPLDGVPVAAPPRPAPPAPQAPEAHSPIQPLWQVEKAAIEAAIATCEGNVPRAAALLEISPSTIYRKRQSWAAQGLD